MNVFGTLPTVNTCLGTCKYTCSNTCSGGCNRQCSNPCKGGCGNNCGAGCVQTCRGFCTNGCYSGCTAACANSCEGKCSGGCGGTCRGGCSGTCKDSCGGCDSGCSSCTGSCAGGCQASCSGKCQGTCSNGCGNQCKDGLFKNLSTFKINDLERIKAEEITFIINAIKYEVSRRNKISTEITVSVGDKIDDSKIKTLIENLKMTNNANNIQIPTEGTSAKQKDIEYIISNLKIAWNEVIDPSL